MAGCRPGATEAGHWPGLMGPDWTPGVDGILMMWPLDENQGSTQLQGHGP